MAPRLDDLLTYRTLRDWVAEFPTREERAGLLERAASRTDNMAMIATIQAALSLVKAGLSSVLFTVDRDTLVGACSSAVGPAGELPPLPFPRILVEPDKDEVWLIGETPEDAAANAAYTEEPGVVSATEFGVQVLGIEEDEQGERWHGIIICADFHRLLGEPPPRLADETPMFGMDYRLSARTGLEVRPPGGTTGWRQMARGHALERLLVECVHFITAHGVTHEPVKVDRAERRRAARAGAPLPTVDGGPYWVVIREPTSSEPRRSGREYHVRWMVRGHWRHLGSGRRTWVRSYLKGPPGAPWKGQPIYQRPASG